MTYHAFVFCSPGKPGNWDDYVKAVKRVGHFQWHYVGAPGFSSAQAKAAVPQIGAVRKLATNCTSLTLIMFSAGYGAGRVLLEADINPDYILSIDSIHDRNLELWEKHAKRLQDRFHFIHTDIQPPYRSTTDVGLALLEQADISVHHVAGADKRAHSKALTIAGPSVLQHEIVPKLLAKFAPVEVPWRDAALTLGERAVQFSLQEAKLGNLETSGHNSGPRIREYFRLAQREARNGRKAFGPGALSKGNWCVVSACYAAQMSLLEGEKLPHEYPVSVIELRESAEKRSTFRKPSYIPKAGDLCLRTRKGQWAGTGHVERVIKLDEDDLHYWTIGGNEGNGWRVEKEALGDDDDIQGWIAYPQERSEKTYYWPNPTVPHDFLKWKSAMDEVDSIITDQDMW